MRRLLTALGLLMSLLPLRAEDRAGPGWKEFAPKDGRFRVLMPGTPKREKQDTESDFGKGVLVMHTVERGGLIYGANYCDFPAAIKKAPADKVLDSSRDGCVDNLNGKLLLDKKVKLGEHPGREVRVGVEGGRVFRARVYLVGRRLYQVVVFGPGEKVTSKEADKFLDSFKLVTK
jgi:hypothetical protein